MTTSLLDNTPAAPRSTHPDAIRDHQAAATMYPTAKPHVLEAPRSAAVQVIRAQTAQERAFYKAENAFGKTQDAKGNLVGVVHALALSLEPKASNTRLAALVPELAATAADTGLSADDITMLTSVISAMAAADPLTSKQAEAKQIEAIGALRKACSIDGPHAFDRALADTLKLASRDPLLKNVLDKTGAFNDPRVFALFAERAKQARQRGELK